MCLQETYLVSLFPGIFISVFRLLLLQATLTVMLFSISASVGIAQKGDTFHGFFPSYFSTTLHPTTIP